MKIICTKSKSQNQMVFLEKQIDFILNNFKLQIKHWKIYLKSPNSNWLKSTKFQVYTTFRFQLKLLKFNFQLYINIKIFYNILGRCLDLW